jgi:hypothetical protein
VRGGHRLSRFDRNAGVLGKVRGAVERLRRDVTAAIDRHHGTEDGGTGPEGEEGGARKPT